MNQPVPVIAIDGPSASGKGTVAAAVAETLGFHFLDSGALYRLVAYRALAAQLPLQDESGLAALARTLDIRFHAGRTYLDHADVTDAIRGEAVGSAASEVAVHPGVRAALLDLQHAFREPPGLVADGRDMGTVVFPDATLKVFLTASALERARRRHKQLMEKGNPANIDDLLRDIELRDKRDMERSAAPLRPAADAIQLDTSMLSIREAVDVVLEFYRRALTPKVV
jgi:cytidylate kinase